MNKDGRLASLAELDGFRSKRLAWDLALPEYVPAEKIEVNVGLIGRVGRLGGIGHFRVGTYNGDRTRTEADIVSMSQEGAATAGMKAVELKSSAAQVDIASDGHTPGGILSEYWWADATVNLNALTLGDKVFNHARQGGSVRDPKVWSHYLNEDLRRGLSHAVKQQLVDNVSLVSKSQLASWAINTTSFEGIGFSFQPRDLVFSALLGSGATQLMTSLYSFFVNEIRERRLSLIPGYQLDRLAIAQGLLRAKRLVKPR